MTRILPWILLCLIWTLPAGVLRAQSETPPARFEASALRVENLVGVLEIEVAEGPAVTVKSVGTEDLLEEIESEVDEGVLVIKRGKSLLDRPPKETFKWRDRYPTVTVRLPPGTPVEIREVIGQTLIGDLNGPLVVNATWLAAEVGNVGDVSVELSGRASLQLGRVSGLLSAKLNSSGELVAESLGRAEINKSGSGNLVVGAVEDGLVYESTGSGDTVIGSVSGPVDAAINGSGHLTIGAGQAEPLVVKITSSGDFVFKGKAVDPDVTVGGSGRAVLGAHSGALRLREFTGTLSTGEDGSLEIAQ